MIRCYEEYLDLFENVANDTSSAFIKSVHELIEIVPKEKMLDAVTTSYAISFVVTVQKMMSKAVDKESMFPVLLLHFLANVLDITLSTEEAKTIGIIKPDLEAMRTKLDELANVLGKKRLIEKLN